MARSFFRSHTSWRGPRPPRTYRAGLSVLLATGVLAVLAACGFPPAEVPASPSAPSPLPSGQIQEGIEVSEAVLEAASAYVEAVRSSWSDPDSKYGSMSGGALFDGWRVEALERADHASGLEGYALEIYQLDYSIHTQTPNALLLTGGMSLDQEGWLTPVEPGSTYLVFDGSGGTPVYLFPLVVEDCSPGTPLFSQRLLSALPESSLT